MEGSVVVRCTSTAFIQSHCFSSFSSSSRCSLPSALVPASTRWSTRSNRMMLVKAVQTELSKISSSTASPVPPRQRRPENVGGEFFVDHTCIDCDTCRWMAPQTFTRRGEMSAVFKQPTCQEERFKALQALLSCPTSSIHTEKPPRDIMEVQDSFPIPIDEQKIPGVYHCGYHSEKSYGATSYLVVHPEGNILVDSPRFTVKLARKIEMLGGAKYMFLTHKDDVADHRKWSQRLNCKRVMHSSDIEASTTDVEMKLEGNGPWRLYDDVQLIHTPGHSAGSVCLFHESHKVLFTGDHIAETESGTMSIFEQYNNCSVPLQLDSIRILLDLDFKWIIPGHGRRIEFKDVQEKRDTLEAFLQSMSS